MTMKITALSPWFGSKRTLAPEIVRQLGPHRYYLEPFCGSMAVLMAKDPSANETVCDQHGALTNLARVIQHPELAPQLHERLQRLLYCEDIYKDSKQWLAANESRGSATPIDWAYHYFVASWMGRNGVSGTARSNYQFTMRWTASGGSGPVRFAAAVDSLPEWHARLRNVCILCRDGFGSLEKVEDEKGLAIYCDPPYLLETRSDKSGLGREAGSARYLHEFTEADHVRLADVLRGFKRARIVVSYYASPRLAELYPGWTQVDCSRQKHLAVQNKRGSKRTEAPEVLIVNGPAASGNSEAISLFEGVT